MANEHALVNSKVVIICLSDSEDSDDYDCKPHAGDRGKCNANDTEIDNTKSSNGLKFTANRHSKETPKPQAKSPLDSHTNIMGESMVKTDANLVRKSKLEIMIGVDYSKEKGGESNADATDDDDSDVIVIDNSEMSHRILPAKASKAVASSATAAQSNNIAKTDIEKELEIIGEANIVRLRHFRQDCQDCRYNPTFSAMGNSSFCCACYCYVCDKLASKCENWIHGRKGKSNGTFILTNSGENPYINHCKATDKGPQKHLWKKVQQFFKNGGVPHPSFLANSHEYVSENAHNATRRTDYSTTSTMAGIAQDEEVMYTRMIADMERRGQVDQAAMTRRHMEDRLARLRAGDQSVFPRRLRTDARRPRMRVGGGNVGDAPTMTAALLSAAAMDFNSSIFEMATGRNLGNIQGTAPSSATTRRQRRRKAPMPIPSPNGKRRPDRASSTVNVPPHHDMKQRVRTHSLLDDLYK